MTQQFGGAQIHHFDLQALTQASPPPLRGSDAFGRWPGLGFQIRALGSRWSDREAGYAVRQIG
ncbi:MAG: hypothetical protein EON93_12485, partial [Burkholderiales bacterium]